MMKCPNCGFDSPTEMSFCGMCGRSLSQACPNCGRLSPLSYHFCGHCGSVLPPLAGRPAGPLELAQDVTTAASEQPTQVSAPVPLTQAALEGERRQATVIIADVKSSTSILEKIGSEAWVVVMNRVLQIMGEAIYRFGGQVDQFRGDGLVAFFGARSAHEDDPERAVLAALALQQSIRSYAYELVEAYHVDLMVRVGINTGEVITANIGNNVHHNEDTTMGEAVTLAARLEAAAEPGTILLSSNTYRLVASRFKWQEIGELQVRGLSYPVTVYRPLSPILESEQQTRLQHHGLFLPMIGRDSELNAIESCIDNLREGIGGILFISGEAGMGKTRLIFEARQHIERDEALQGSATSSLTWLQGRCRSYEHTLPDSMWIDLWQRWLGFGRWISRSEALDRLREQTRYYWGDRFEEFYPYLAAFLSLPLEEPYASQVQHLDAEGLRRRYFLTIRSWLEILSRQSPLAIVFTEAHWADEASLELLKFCLPLCAQERILFMVIFRPERTTPAWGFKQFVETEFFHRLTSLELLPLNEAQSIHLIEEMIGPNVLSNQATAQILEKSNGNPFYLTELIHSLVEKGILVCDSQTEKWHATGNEILLDLPDTLKSLLLARIDRLSPEERRVLQLAAVIGPIFWFNVLEVLARNGADPLRAHLAALQRAQVIAERGLLPDLGMEYAFSSALIREAAYESTLSSQRAEWHQIVADYLEQIVHETAIKQYHGIVAHHFRQAHNCQKELFHTMLAAQEAQRIHANAEAVQAFEHALSLMDQGIELECMPSGEVLDEWRLEALRGMGKIQFGIGKVQEAEKNFRRAIDLGRTMSLQPPELTRLYYWLGDVLFWQNSYEEPIQLGEEGLRLLGDQNESVEAALMNQLVAIGSSQLGDHDKFIDYTLRTAGFIQRLPYSEELRPAFDHIIALYGYTLKDISAARRWLEILKQKAEEHFDLRALGEYYEYSAVMHYQEGNPKGALPGHRQAIEQFSQIGDFKHVSRAWKSLGVSQLHLGAVEEANDCFTQALKTAEVFGNEADYAIGYWYKGQVLLCLKDWKAALASFEKAGLIVRDVPYLNVEWALSGVGRTYLAQGRKASALKAYQAALQQPPNTLFQNSYQANEILSGLERSFNHPGEFRAYVDQYYQSHPEIHHSALKQWYLIPVEARSLTTDPEHHEVFNDALLPGWEWHDPFKDCHYHIQQGLTIRAANERNMFHINRSAPKLLRQQALVGDFTLQTICQPAAKNKPGIGGLIVWMSDKYWFCLEVGGRGPGDITLRGFLNNHDQVFGRGLLKAKSVYLRLERRGHWLSAFCSEDGQDWLTAGGCELSTGEPLQLGLQAIGHINRMVYPGAYTAGTALRFTEFWLWG